MPFLIAIVGRPNVGKSTLFNRLAGGRPAIVDAVAGVTRDRHYGHSEWNGKKFSVVDTGGYVQGSDDIFEDEIRRQVKIAIDEASLLLFVVDAFEGITPLDEDVADMIRRAKKKTILVANKVDNPDRIAMAAEFYSLGVGEPYCISSINGAGTGELLDEVAKLVPDEEPVVEDPAPRIAIVGRPNVGKSSLINAILGVDKHIVTNIAGTTRDSINTRFKGFGHDMWLIDTAGLRRKTKVHEDLEFYSVMRTIRAIEDCDVCLLMIDAKDGIEAQDLAIFDLAQKNRKGIAILVNKWDLVENKENNTIKEYEERIRERIAPFRDVPILFVSAHTKQRVLKALDVAQEVYENRNRHIPTSKLNEVMLDVIAAYEPPSIKGKYVKIKYVQQLHSATPIFAFFCNLPQYVGDSYKRYLENKLREHFNFSGVPITVTMRKK
jgi:GTP-binding protein